MNFWFEKHQHRVYELIKRDHAGNYKQNKNKNNNNNIDIKIIIILLIKGHLFFFLINPLKVLIIYSYEK